VLIVDLNVRKLMHKRLPLSIGIETLGGVFIPLIKQDTPLPTKVMQAFSTAEDGQSAVTVRVYKGEDEYAPNNILIGQFDFAGIPPAPRGVPKIEVTFNVDHDGELSVTARDADTKNQYSVTFWPLESGSPPQSTKNNSNRLESDAGGPPRNKIFLSYRRSDTQMIAGRVYDRLEAAFGKGRVFYDVDAIPLGVDFRSHIRHSILQCYCLVALIGADWIGASSVSAPRISDHTDFVRAEIELAINANIRIVPLLVGSARMPSPAEVPQSLVDFCYLNAARIDVGPDFHSNMDRIVKALQQVT
jgi:hypothetical protein